MVKLGDGSSEPFAGRSMGGPEKSFADSTLATIDAEVRTLVDAAHADAYWALNENRDVLDRLAYDLLEKETLDEKQLSELFHDVVKRDRRTVWLASHDRPVSSRPPIDPPAPRAANGGGTEEQASGGAGSEPSDPDGVDGQERPR